MAYIPPNRKVKIAMQIRSQSGVLMSCALTVMTQMLRKIALITGMMMFRTIRIERVIWLHCEASGGYIFSYSFA